MNPTRTLLVTLAASGLLVGAAATAGLLSAGGASAAGAFPAVTSPTPTPAPKATPGAPGQNGPQVGPGHGRFGGRGGFGGLRGQGPLLHGEFVIGGQNGSTQTFVVQTGTVTVKNGSTITVTSTDGYKVDWTLNDSTKVRTGWSQGAVKDIAQGDTVHVEGTKSGNTTTAAFVAERPKSTTTPGNGSSGSPSPSGA